jgi:hypothetical protein
MGKKEYGGDPRGRGPDRGPQKDPAKTGGED